MPETSSKGLEDGDEWVLNTAGVERSLLASVKERKLVYFGHVMRMKGDSLEKEIMQGTTPGSRSRGRPKTAWMSNITSWTGLSVEQLLSGRQISMAVNGS